MLLFIILTAVLNLGLGFAVAVYLAQHKPACSGNGQVRVPRSVPVPNARESAVENVADPGAAAVAESASTNAGRLDAESAVHPAGADAASVPADEAIADAKGNPAQAPEPDSSQASVTAIQDEVTRYDEQLSELTDEFRNPSPEADAAWLQEQAQSLRSVNEEYLESRNEAYEEFESLHRVVEDYAAVCESLEETMLLQTTKIHESNDVIEATDFQGDLHEGAKRMVAEANKLTDVNHLVRDALETTLVSIARQDQWLHSFPAAMRCDALTGLANRAGLEADLAEWWSNDPRRARQLSIALADLDHFGKLNESDGRIVGDQVLRALAQLLTEENCASGLVTRYGGQRFAMVFHDTDIRCATNVVERVRQTVEMSCFQVGEQEIRVTLSCGVTEAALKDTSESLLDRVETTVREAKRYGRNRTFVHDGRFPTPVVPPSYTVQERQIPL